MDVVSAREGKRPSAEMDSRPPVKARGEPRLRRKRPATRAVMDIPTGMDSQTGAFVGCERSEVKFKLVGGRIAVRFAGT